MQRPIILREQAPDVAAEAVHIGGGAVDGGSVAHGRGSWPPGAARASASCGRVRGEKRINAPVKRVIPLLVICAALAGTLLVMRGAKHPPAIAPTTDVANGGDTPSATPSPKVVKPLPKGVAPGTGRWWETTAPNLVAWAAYLDRSADAPAKPTNTLPSYNRRILRASPLRTTFPSVTWPSPPMADLPWCRTARMVVP